MLVVNLIIFVILKELHDPYCVAVVEPYNPKFPPYFITPTTDPRVEFYKKMGWKKAIHPWLQPANHRAKFLQLYNNVVIFIINKKNYLVSNREQTYIATGVFISSTRVLTSFNPFKKFLQDPEVVSKTLILSVNYFLHSKKYGHAYVAARVDTIQCGREIIPLPDGADVFYMDKEKLYSPLHDLMVFRISEPKEFLHPDAYNEWLEFSPKWRFWNISVAGMPLATSINTRPRFFNVIGLGFINETQVKKFNKMHSFIVASNPVDILDCDNWIPREWGYFICIRNFLNIPVLPSGSVLLSDEHVFGVGSFMLTRNGEEILVFTDVRPYRNQLLTACSEYEFEDTPHKDIWW